MNEHETLDREVGGMKLRDMTAITFIAILAKRLNGINTYNSDAQALLGYVSNPPLGKMSDDTKIEIINRLEKLGLTIW